MESSGPISGAPVLRSARYSRLLALFPALLAGLAAGALAGCTTSGFDRPVDLSTPRVAVLSSGVRFRDVIPGEGASVTYGTRVSVHYVGTLEDGSVFDSSHDRGLPLEFTVGEGEVVVGLEEGVIGMRVGGTRSLVIPPEQGYGVQGLPGLIPPDATVTLEVDLLEALAP